MSYSLVKGNLEPDMGYTLTAPGAKAALATALAINLQWRKPDGTIVSVPMVLVDAPTWQIKRVWVAGDSALVGVHKGIVFVTAANGETTSDPIDGSDIIWWVVPDLNG